MRKLLTRQAVTYVVVVAFALVLLAQGQATRTEVQRIRISPDVVVQDDRIRCKYANSDTVICDLSDRRGRKFPALRVEKGRRPRILQNTPEGSQQATPRHDNRRRDATPRVPRTRSPAPSQSAPAPSHHGAAPSVPGEAPPAPSLPPAGPTGPVSVPALPPLPQLPALPLP